MFRLALLALLTTGCIQADVSGTVDHKVLSPEIRQLDGVIYVRFGLDCIAIDETATYPAKWSKLLAFDAARETPYTETEIETCLS